MSDEQSRDEKPQPDFQPFEHYCHCGKWGAFGVGVARLKGREGKWYCLEHLPPEHRNF